MQQFPHRYSVVASGGAEGEVRLEGARLSALTTAAPAEFGGPGDRWSPETLCVGAVADCFVLTFRALARAAKLPWVQLRCQVEGTLDRVERVGTLDRVERVGTLDRVERVGTLDRVERVTQFTSFLVRATLEVPSGVGEEQALRLLERTERSCLITNSLKATSRLEASVETAK